MLVVRIELWPYGLADAKELLANATIENSGRDKTGFSYRAQLRERPDPELGIQLRDQTIHISGYDRRQSVWNLVLRVLAAAWFDHEVKARNDPMHALVEQTAADNEALGLFVDVLPSAWGLTETQVEQLLHLAPGWLRAWRNHEVQFDSSVRNRIWKLGLLQKRICQMAKPEDYSTFWHRAWADTSPLGNRSPWQAFEEDGDEALRLIQQFLDSGI